MVIHKVAPAIATNNRIVLKPSEKTPLAALPAGRHPVRSRPAAADAVGASPATRRKSPTSMLTNPDVDLVTFTGGVPIGKYIATEAVYKRQILELGGNDPIIVMEDADVEEAAYARRPAARTRTRASAAPRSSACWCTSRWPTSSSSCWCAEDPRMKYGDPMDPDTDMGTVIDEARRQAVRGAWSTRRSPPGAKLLHRQRAPRRAVFADGARPRATRR